MDSAFEARLPVSAAAAVWRSSPSQCALHEIATNAIAGYAGGREQLILFG